MLRRAIAFGALVCGLVLAIVSPRGADLGMYAIQTLGPYFILADTSTGYYYTDASGGEAFAYEADAADTAGLGLELTIIKTTGDTVWYRTDLPTNTYDLLWRDDTDTVWVGQNVPVWTSTLGDSSITDSLQFKADVVPSEALRDWCVHTAHLDSAAVTKFKLGAGAVDSTRLASLAVFPVHMAADQDHTFDDLTVDSFAVQKIALANTSEPALTISMTSITTTDNQAIDITGGEALDAEEHWTGIRVKPDDLDPGGNDTRIRGMAINLSGVDVSNPAESFEALRLVMSEGETALHITEGVARHDYTAPSDAGATFPVHDFAIDSEALVATSAVHILSASTVGTPSGVVSMLGTYDEIDPVHQHIGAYTTPSQTEFAGEKTTGGTVWVDGIDASEIFVVKDDEIAVGAVAKFSALEVIMTTPGTKTVVPTFWFATAADTWTQFYPVDNTNGFQQTGTIFWDEDGLASWSALGDPGAGETTAGYWVKVIRSGNPDPGTPTPTTIKTGTLVEYSWDKAGDLLVSDIDCDTLTVDSSLVVGGTQWDNAAGKVDASAIDIAPSSGYATLRVYNDALHVRYNSESMEEVTTGLILDVAPSSGSATLVIEEDAVQVKYSAMAFVEDASLGLNIDTTPDAGSPTLVLAEDALQVYYDVQAFGEGASGLEMDVTPGSGNATLVVEDDALQVDYASADFSEGAVGLKLHQNVFHLADIDTSRSGEFVDAAATSQIIYKVGAAVGQQLLCFPIGTPGYTSGIEDFEHTWAGSCRVEDSLDVFKPRAEAALGNDRWGFIILTWPWDGPNEPK